MTMAVATLHAVIARLTCFFRGLVSKLLVKTRISDAMGMTHLLVQWTALSGQVHIRNSGR
uniref:Transposase n=1 Tax=Magnetococcus massalia (strain MO-1) TaxID=451514 RepID=A0A1S7LJ08_MAGMO|nr:Protein of unknown function [Candidatus Magnetococcus massalia]